jgi:hypothetical protein
MMKIDKKKILEDAKKYYGGKIHSEQSYGLAEKCVDLGQVWVDTYKQDYGALMRKSPKEMRKELNKYVGGRISYSEHNATFLPGFIWMWIAHAIITWIIKKIIDNILEQEDEERYLTDTI